MLRDHIWLPDNNGCKIVQALIRAAARGVACRAIADDLGSRTMIDSEQWRSMREAGVLLAAASRSYYADPLAAGAHIFGCRSGLLHSKTLTLDGEVTLIGSANMDRRSFELGYENNILLHDRALTAEVHQRHRQSGTGALSGGTRRVWVPGAVAHQRVSLFRPINPATQ